MTMRYLPLALLLSAPLVAAWVPHHHTGGTPGVGAAFQAPSKNPRRPRNDQPRRNDNEYEPYDWENDKLGFIDEESERPWKIDELKQNALTIRPRQESLPSSQKQTLMSRWNQKLNPFSKSTQVPQPPINSRARLSTTDAGTLVIDLPATGMDSRAISSGVFGALWFSAIVPATFAGGLASAVFLLPFWLAGGAVAKNAVVDPFVTSQLTIGKYAWSLSTTYANTAQIRQVDGSTQDLRGASVEDLNLEVNGKSFYEIKLFGDKGVIQFGNGLAPDELEYLSYIINDHLREMRKDGNRDDAIHGFISGLKKD